MFDQELTVVERCPLCGGRVSAQEEDPEAGKHSVQFICVGTSGEEMPCGWTTVRTPSQVHFRKTA